MEVPRPRDELELKLQPMPQPWQHHIWAASVTYATACNNAWSLIHWLRLGIEPASLQGQHWERNLLSHKSNSKELLIETLLTESFA